MHVAPSGAHNHLCDLWQHNQWVVLAHATNQSTVGVKHRVLCTPNLNRHASTILGRCAGAQASASMLIRLSLSVLGAHSFTPSWRLDTTEILQGNLACPSEPPVYPMQASLVTKLSTIYDAHPMPSNVDQNQQNPLSIGHFNNFFLKNLQNFKTRNVC